MSSVRSKTKPKPGIAAILAGTGVALLAACQPEAKNENPTEEGQVTDNTAPTSPWTLTDTVDPMTDQRLLTATGTFEADNYLIETTLTCQPAESRLEVTFTTFDVEGDPAKFREVWFDSYGYPNHRVTLRIDEARAQLVSDQSPRFTNEFQTTFIHDPHHASGAFVKDAAIFTARILRVQFPLVHGDALLTLDLTDPTVTTVLQACPPRQPTPPADPRDNPAFNDTPLRFGRGVDSRVDLRDNRNGAEGAPATTSSPPATPSDQQRSDREKKEADRRAAERSAYEANQKAQQAKLCASILPTAPADYRREMGC